MIEDCRLEVPHIGHRQAYERMMDRWEALEANIAPELLRRFSKKEGANVSYEKWLSWCEDDRTTGSMLSTGVPCTLHFLLEQGEIIGAMAINHAATHRGHLHAGIAPWKRGRGYGTKMLRLALDECRRRGMEAVEIVPHKDNAQAIATIVHCGGELNEEFFEEGRWSVRYRIRLMEE